VAQGAVQQLIAPVADSRSDPADNFEVNLENFEGHYDLMHSLIAKHKLDITEVALSRVTDDFVAHIRSTGPEWDLDQTSEFLVVAATLLDLKAARLLPAGEVEDEDDLALLEARDLLFARLLQYKAYKEVASVFAARMGAEALRFPRAVGIEERYARLLPEVVFAFGHTELAAMAARALEPRPAPTIATAHLHQPRVSIREQAAVLVDRLRRSRSASFRALSADCPTTLHVVARFLALLELYRERVVAFEQLAPLGELTVRWTGSDVVAAELSVDEYDQSGQVVPADQNGAG